MVMCRLFLTRPCCVALGRVLLYVFVDIFVLCVAGKEKIKQVNIQLRTLETGCIAMAIIACCNTPSIIRVLYVKPLIPLLT